MTIDEVVTGVVIALNEEALVRCPRFDTNGDGAVTINELVAAVGNALNGCGESIELSRHGRGGSRRS